MKLSKIIKLIIFIPFVMFQAYLIFRMSYLIDSFLFGFITASLIMVFGLYYLLFKCEYRLIKRLFRIPIRRIRCNSIKTNS